MLRILLATILLLLSGSLAHAAVCGVTIGDLAFGAVDTIGNVDATTSTDVTINCSGVTTGTDTVTVCGNIGPGSGGAIDGVRETVPVGGGSLRFGLYTQPGTTPAWGSRTSSGLGDPNEIDVPVSGNSADATVKLYGIVPRGQQTAPTGAYRSDFGSSDIVFTYAEGSLSCSEPTGGTDVTAAFAMTANVAANCLLQTTDLDFGTAGIIGSNIDADADLSITCTPGTGYSISIDGGGSHDPDHRLLRSGTNTVSYGLYPDTTYSRQWGTDPDSVVPGTGDGTRTHHAVYGRIPPQPAVAGAYADTVVVTITY